VCFINELYSQFHLAPIRGAFFTPSETFETDSKFQEQSLNVKYSNTPNSYDILPVTSLLAYNTSNPVLIYYPAVKTTSTYPLPLVSSSICSDRDSPSTHLLN
jgi:hypothetical protein